MADLIARHDPVTDYVHVSSADEYPIPADVWDWLRAEPYRGQYANAHRGELRFDRVAATDAVAALREAGHRVRTVTATRPGDRPGHRLRGPLECSVCAQPYPVSKIVSPGEMCANPSMVMVNRATGERAPEYPPHALDLTPPPG